MTAAQAAALYGKNSAEYLSIAYPNKSLTMAATAHKLNEFNIAGPLIGIFIIKEIRDRIAPRIDSFLEARNITPATFRYTADDEERYIEIDFKFEDLFDVLFGGMFYGITAIAIVKYYALI